MTDIWAVIPAAMKSKRFPGKPLVLLNGITMIQHVYERAKLAQIFSRILVATPDVEIQRAVEQFGGEAHLTDGYEHTGTDGIAQIVGRVITIDTCPEWVMNIQGDEIGIDPGDLRYLMNRMLNVVKFELREKLSPPVMGTLINSLRDGELNDPNVVKVVPDASYKAIYFTRCPVPGSWKHIGVYMFRADFLFTFAALRSVLERQEELEQMRALDHGYKIKCFLASSHSFSINTPVDLEKYHETQNHK